MRLPDLADLPYAAHLTAPDGGELSCQDYDTVLFDSVEFTEPDAASVSFLECALRRVSLTGGRLQRARLRDVWMTDVRFTGTQLPESGWLDVTVRASVLAGVALYGARLQRAVFSECKLDSVNFRAASLEGVTFDRCDLRDVDFGGAALSGCSFGGSRLTRTDLTGATTHRTDLRDAELGIIIDPQSLRGAVVSAGQLVTLAPVLAECLGVVVSDG